VAACALAAWGCLASEDAGLSGGPGPIRDPSVCQPELGGSCNAVFQCGCGSGERCIVSGTGDGSGHSKELCVPEGTDPIDATCTIAGDRCAAGLQCYGGSAASRSCMQFCYDERDCPASRECEFRIDGVTRADGGGYRLCGPPRVDCDPFTNAGCDADRACVLVPGEGLGTCDPAGTAGAGESCDTGGCRPGHGCYRVGEDPGNRCYAFCRLGGGAPDCSAVPGASCVGGLGSDTVGICLPR
jgi:hypothetical protein